MLGRLWIQGFESLATVLGLVAAGIAIALNDVLTNIAGWIYILWDAPFAIGDRIEIESSQGDVIDIGLFKFTLLEVWNRVLIALYFPLPYPFSPDNLLIHLIKIMLLFTYLVTQQSNIP